MSRRWRITAYAIGGVLALVVLGVVIVVYVLLQPDRFTAMLKEQAEAAGLELSLSQPASPALFPHPSLELKGITLSAQDATMPIMLAAQGRLTVPWSTLFGGPTVISQLEINSPRVDLDALQDWLATLPGKSAGGPLQVPRVDTGVVINHASLVRGNSLLLGDMTIQSGPLKPGKVFSLGVDATDTNNDPVQLRLLATPRMHDGGLQLADIVLNLSHGSGTTLDLRGSARWHGAAAASASLAGKLDQAGTGQYQISIRLEPATENDPLLLLLKLDGPGNHADLRLPPLELVAWWAQVNNAVDPRLSLPPGSGHVEAQHLELGGISIDGLTLDASPAAASSTQSPASASSSQTAVSGSSKR